MTWDTICVRNKFTNTKKIGKEVRWFETLTRLDARNVLGTKHVYKHKKSINFCMIDMRVSERRKKFLFKLLHQPGINSATI